AKGLHKMD
uniref:Uncharacterized protein n=1 Tax=Solanum lycopersicum TaxID=4081 RepID=A0A3Q7ITK5_SOLLC